jgi:subtilisin family serine protease
VATALIPTDKIMEVAALPNVTNIEVGEIMQTHNDQQRTLTRAYDAITNSSAAQALGITSPYTGKGVIVGIIDQGIDFQHIAFKDKNGKSRIIRALTLKAGSTLNYDVHSTEEAINNLTYDTNNADHGTHTSAIAAGSSVIVNGNDVTVTDDHANATYGGMAPEADLVIIGLRTISTTNMANSIKHHHDGSSLYGCQRKSCMGQHGAHETGGSRDETGVGASHPSTPRLRPDEGRAGTRAQDGLRLLQAEDQPRRETV